MSIAGVGEGEYLEECLASHSYSGRGPPGRLVPGPGPVPETAPVLVPEHVLVPAPVTVPAPVPAPESESELVPVVIDAGVHKIEMRDDGEVTNTSSLKTS